MAKKTKTVNVEYPQVPEKISFPVTFDQLFSITGHNLNLDQLKVMFPADIIQIHQRLEDIGDNHVEEACWVKDFKMIDYFDNTWEPEGDGAFYFKYGLHAGAANYQYGFTDEKILKSLIADCKKAGFEQGDDETSQIGNGPKLKVKSYVKMCSETFFIMFKYSKYPKGFYNVMIDIMDFSKLM